MVKINQIQLIVDKSNLIIRKSQEEKSYIFDLTKINKFIDASVEAIISNLEDIGYKKN